MPSAKGKGLNCLGLLSRNNKLMFTTTTGNITSHFVFDYLERLSFTLEKPTVIVLDNASIHTAKIIQQQRKVWEIRGLILFYLPPYSPQLNLIEILWKMLKYYWLKPEDYAEEQLLFYITSQALAAVGNTLNINFSEVALV